MSVDGSFIQANADHHSRVPREQLAEVAQVNRTVREYLAELEQENPVEPPVPQQEQVSTTDPDSTYATKGGPARLGYYNNYLIDNSSCVIVGVQATPARLSHESLAARQMNRAPSATLRIGAAYAGCGHYVRQRRTAAMAA